MTIIRLCFYFCLHFEIECVSLTWEILSKINDSLIVPAKLKYEILNIEVDWTVLDNTAW